MKIILAAAALIAVATPALADSQACMLKAMRLTSEAKIVSPRLQSISTLKISTAELERSKDIDKLIDLIAMVTETRELGATFVKHADEALTYFSTNCPQIDREVSPHIATARDTVSAVVKVIDDGFGSPEKGGD